MATEVDPSILREGLRSQLPGLDRAIKTLEEDRARLTLMIAAIEGREHVNRIEPEAQPEPVRRRGRPPNNIRPAAELLVAPTVRAMRHGWPEDPEERRVEALRRQAVRAERRAAKEAEARAEALREVKAAAGRKRWENMPKAQRKAHLAKMAAGRKKQAPVVRMELAS
jgi:hypothetical protein